MKKNISFEKQIEFPTMIGEICAISLEKQLKFVDSSTIEGDLLLTGRYKLTEASLVEEDFQYKIPIDISLTEKIDSNTGKIEIADFYYEIENDDTMICYIDLEISGDEILEVRECDGEMLEDKEIEIPVLDSIKEEIIEEKEDKEDEKKIIVEEEKTFFQLDEDDDSYGTFIVYIVRENETVNTIIEKYHTTLEKIEQYNDLNQFTIGTKLIIPLEKENE